MKAIIENLPNLKVRRNELIEQISKLENNKGNVSDEIFKSLHLQYKSELEAIESEISQLQKKCDEEIAITQVELNSVETNIKELSLKIDELLSLISGGISKDKTTRNFLSSLKRQKNSLKLKKIGLEKRINYIQEINISEKRSNKFDIIKRIVRSQIRYFEDLTKQKLKIKLWTLLIPLAIIILYLTYSLFFSTFKSYNDSSLSFKYPRFMKVSSTTIFDDVQVFFCSNSVLNAQAHSTEPREVLNKIISNNLPFISVMRLSDRYAERISSSKRPEKIIKEVLRDYSCEDVPFDIEYPKQNSGRSVIEYTRCEISDGLTTNIFVACGTLDDGSVFIIQGFSSIDDWEQNLKYFKKVFNSIKHKE